MIQQSPATTARPALRLQVGGTLVPGRDIYIARPEDEELFGLLSGGEYVNILSSRQVGKSSVMLRAALRLRERGHRFAVVDLTSLGTPENARAYFRGLVGEIARQLKLQFDRERFWREDASAGTNTQQFIRFFREVVAVQIQGRVLVFLDEIDSTLKLPFTDDLLTALRSMYNERALVPEYQRITFCLVGVATPNELIKDRRTTPYNVGKTLWVGDFDAARDDLTPLVNELSDDSQCGAALLGRVLFWTGGHPFLTARLCHDLRAEGATTPDDVDRFVAERYATLDRLGEDVHIQQVQRFVRERLTEGLASFDLYERILKGGKESDQPSLAHAELKLSGLVKRDRNGILVPRNRIYSRLFGLQWVRASRPKQEVRRYRRYAYLAMVLSVVGAAVTLGYYQAVVAPLRAQAAGDVHLAQGDFAGALESYRASLAIRERLARVAPGNAGWQHNLSVSYNSIGDVQRAQGDLQAALISYRASLAIAERLAAADPSNSTWQHNLSVSYARIGDMQRTQGDLPAALTSYRASLAIAERLAAVDPSNSTLQRDLSVSYNSIGDAQRAQGDLRAALTSYRASLAIAERLAAADPSNSTLQRDLSVSYNSIGDVQRAQGDLQAALISYRASLAIAERLAAADPSNSAWQHNLSVSYARIGDMQRTQGDLRAALTSYRASLAIAERLAAADPSNSTLQRDLSVSYARIGDMQQAQGDLRAALTSYRASLAIAERLAAADPSNAAWQRDLSVSYNSIGDVQRAQGDLPAALTSYRASLAIAERLAQADPSNAAWQRDLMVNYAKLSVVSGDKAYAAKALDLLLALRQRGLLDPNDEVVIKNLTGRAGR